MLMARVGISHLVLSTWASTTLETPRPSRSSQKLTRVCAGRETGTVCSLVYDIPNKKISTLISFSKGHWEHPQEAHGDKRKPQDFERWRGLAKLGHQAERFMLSEQADIKEIFKGAGDLVPIERDVVTI